MKKSIVIFSLFLVFVLLFGCTSEVKEKAGKAVEQKNPALCKDLGDEGDVKKCYFLVAEEMDDANVCLQATDVPNCVGRFASAKDSTKYCDLLTDTTQKYGCVVKVTGDQTGRAIGEILEDWRGNGTIIKCKEGCEATKDKCYSREYDNWQKANEDCFAKYPTDEDNRYYCEDGVKKTFESNKLICYDAMQDCERGCEQ
jgi:hypothetical protein